MPEINGMRGVGHIDDRCPIRLRLTRHRIDGIRDRVRSAVMPDIGDPALALLLDRRLIGAARLQIARADEAHVERLWRIADLRSFSECGPAAEHGGCERRCYVHPRAFHDAYS